MHSDLSGYSPRFVRFARMPLHAEAYRAAYLDQSAASSNELARLRREYETLPARHAGWCIGECPAEHCGLSMDRCARAGHGHGPCQECRRLRDSVQYKDIGVEIGRSGARGEPPMPSVLMLDLERALDALGERESAARVAQWLTEGM